MDGKGEDAGRGPRRRTEEEGGWKEVRVGQCCYDGKEGGAGVNLRVARVDRPDAGSLVNGACSRGVWEGEGGIGRGQGIASQSEQRSLRVPPVGTSAAGGT